MVIQELAKSHKDWETALSAFEKVHLIVGKEGQEISKAVKEFSNIVTTKEGKEAYEWAKKSFDSTFNNASVVAQKDTLKMLLKSKDYKKAIVSPGKTNGKLLKDLSKEELLGLDTLSDSFIANTWSEFSANWKVKKIKLWSSLDTSVKQNYINRWVEKGVVPPRKFSFLSESDMALWKQASKEEKAVGTVNGKLIGELKSGELTDLSFLHQSVKDSTFSGKPAEWKAEKLKLWNSLDTSAKKAYLDIWREDGWKIPKDLMGITEKKLVEQPPIVSKGKIENAPTTKMFNDLSNSQKQIFLKIDDILSNGLPLKNKDMIEKFLPVWNELNEAAKLGNLEAWKKAGADIPKEILGKIKLPERVVSEYKITTLSKLNELPEYGIHSFEELKAANIDPQVMKDFAGTLYTKMSKDFSEEISKKWNKVSGQMDWNKFVDEALTKFETRLPSNDIVEAIHEKAILHGANQEDLPLTPEEYYYWIKMDDATKRKLLKDWAGDVGAELDDMYQEDGVVDWLNNFKIVKDPALTEKEHETLEGIGEKIKEHLLEGDDGAIPLKEAEKTLWSKIPETKKEIYLEMWATEEGAVMEDLFPTIEWMEKQLGNLKVGAAIEKPIKEAPLTLVKAGPKTYDLTKADELAKYKANSSYNVNEYAKNIAQGKKVTSTQQDFFNQLSIGEKNAVEAKIGKLKVKYRVAEATDIVQPAINSPQPLNFKNMVQYKPQAGSNTGAYYQNVNNLAERYYIKTPANEEIAKNEMLASKLYQAAGVEVPDLQFIDVNGQKSIASSIIDGVSEDKALLTSGKLRAGIYDNFVVDAWLGDWDVVGLNYDNLLIKDGVRAVRIDVGGSLLYRAQGTSKGLNFGDVVTELKSMRDGRTNPSAANVFRNIKKAELENGVRKVLSVSDDKIRSLVEEFGPSDVATRQALSERLIARKKYIQEQFPDIKVDIAAPLSSDLKDRIADVEFEAIKTSRINGKTLRFDKEEIEDQQVLFWTEKDYQNKPIVGAQLKLTKDGAKKIENFLSSEGVSIKSYNSSTIHDPILEAMRGIAQQSRKGEVLRAEKDIVRAQKAIKTYYDELSNIGINRTKYVASDIEELRRHYEPWIKILEDVVKTGAGKKFKIANDSSNYIHSNLTRFREIKEIVKENLEKEITIQFVKSKGDIVAKEIKKGFAKHTNKNLSRASSHAGGFYESEINGVKFQYWPNKEEVPFAFRGVMRITTNQEGKIDIDKIVDILENKLQINMTRPDAVEKELLYLKQVTYSRNDEFGRELLKTISGTPEQQVEILKKELSKKAGYDITKSKNYNPEGIETAFGTGKINYYRPDLDGNEWDEFRKNYCLHHNLHIEASNFAKEVLNNGGELISSVEKTRKGIDFKGMSPEEDLRTGGGSYLFTRLKTVSKGRIGLSWKSDLVSRVDAISYDHDKYGRVTANVVKDFRKSGVEGWTKCANSSGNETIFKQSLSIFDPNFDKWVCSIDDRNEIIKIFKEHGYKRWPDGRRLEDVIIGTE